MLPQDLLQLGTSYWKIKSIHTGQPEQESLVCLTTVNLDLVEVEDSTIEHKYVPEIMVRSLIDAQLMKHYSLSPGASPFEIIEYLVNLRNEVANFLQNNSDTSKLNDEILKVTAFLLKLDKVREKFPKL